MFSAFRERFNIPRREQPGTSRASDMDRDSESSYQYPSAKKHCSRAEATMSSNGQPLQVDNSEALIAKIATLYAERLMSDITLIVNGVHYPAHRLILCASSDVFQVMLMNPNWSESHQTMVELRETVDCAGLFEDFLKYLYTGSLKLTLDNAVHLLTLADKYNVKDLTAVCLRYMLDHIPSAASHNNLIHWFHYAGNCAHDDVFQVCRNYIKWNFEDVAKASSFSDLDLQLLVSILSDDDVVVFDEFALFMYIERWIQAQKDKFSLYPCIESKMSEVVIELASCIRFPLISIDHIPDILLSSLVRQYNDPLLNHLALAMAFHKGRKDELESLAKDHPNRQKLFTPRLYLIDKWSVCMNVDNFSEMSHYSLKTLVFSTPVTFVEDGSDKQVEWVLDLYPKGVMYEQHFLIWWQSSRVVPASTMRTVRLSILCKNEEEKDVRVQIGVLIIGMQDGVEHVIKCVKKNYIFSKNDRMNLDNLIPYEELNKCAACSKFRSGSSPSAEDNSCCTNSTPCRARTSKRTPYLVGPNGDCLKIKVIITPKQKLQQVARMEN